VDVVGVEETLSAFKGLESDMRKQANAELRVAAKECAGGLVTALQAAAAGAATPVAARVASSIKVKSDRIPVVSIGGSKRVGRRGAPASALVWGSEQGGKNFAASAGGSYWIAPTVDAYASSAAIPRYNRAVWDTMRRWKLV
jgi:hypothetical protein